MPYNAKASDTPDAGAPEDTEQASSLSLGKPSGLSHHLQKVLLRDGPKLTEAFDWNVVFEEFTPIVRDVMGFVERKPVDE